jgi:small-conductance mechanosensitive channel
LETQVMLGAGRLSYIQQAQHVALETIRQVAGVAEAPAPDVLVDALTASTVNLHLRFYTNSQRADYLKVGSECMRRVKEAFMQAHIALPTDTQTIIVQNPEALPQPGSDRLQTRQVIPEATAGERLS